MKTSLRRCVACYEMKEKAKLIRVAKTAQGVVSIDESFKAEGRGAYVCRSKVCMEKTIKKRGFDRSYKSSVPKEVYEMLTTLMADL